MIARRCFMREFTCKSLGNNCGWKHVARTEELLLDIVAIHLRDVHGVQALTPEKAGTIKRTFSAADPVEARGKSEDPVLKEFLCKDLGMDCGFRYIAQTEELIADGVAVHARDAHGISEFTPEMAAKVKNLAHEWKGR
jgi:predicted small metal-binding protein